MPRKAYTLQQRQEAVALGRVMGAGAAGKQLNIDPRSIVKWTQLAGDAPELAGSAGQWQRLLDLAHARTEAALASGKLTAVQVATIAGIAQRHVSKPVAPVATSSVMAKEAYVNWLFAEVIGGAQSEEGIDALCDDELDEAIRQQDLAISDESFDSLIRELLRRANTEWDADPASHSGVPTGHRLAMLAWFSGRTEVMADDILAWAQDQTRSILAEHGSLEGLRQWELAEREVRRAADIAQAEKSRLAALAWTQRPPDPEIEELAAEAHRSGHTIW